MNKEALDVLSHQLVAVLADALPRLSDDWWREQVIGKLTYQQQGYIQTTHITGLDQLDLAALLRILDQNWHEITVHRAMPLAVRNWVKEAQTLRNRWAHAPTQGIPNEDVYRDLDTIERLAQALGAPDPDLKPLRGMKSSVMAALAGNSPAATQTLATEPSGAFTPGAVVRLKAKPSITGAVIAHLPGDPEDRYQVFHDGTVTTYYASQLEAVAATPARASIPPPTLHAALSALQLRHPSTGSLYSLFASRINFVPYQFRPVLKLIQADRPRLLIADEVGVGKTIEAGLILKELQARRDIRSVLVICPKPLVAERKWLEELKRFDEQFVHLDGPALRYCLEETHLDGVWPQQNARAILPYSLLDETLLMGKQQGRKKQRGLLDLDPPPSFDLVIVDEAHHIRNTDTWAYRCVRYFCDNAEAVVLLTATPIQLGDNDLYTLLHLLRPDVLPGRREFDQMAEPNPHINAAVEAARGAREGWMDTVRAAISQAVATPWGRHVLSVDNRLQDARDLLDAETGNPENRLTLIRTLEALHTFAPLINRTRRRDIGNFTTRKPETVPVDYTPEQDALHHDLIQLIGRMLAQRHGDKNLQFMLTTVRRQVASCVFGLAPLLSDILNRHLSQVQLSEMGDEDSPDEIGEALADFRVEVEALILRARALTGPDPKFDAFLKVIRDKQSLPNNKLLVFSTFRHTLAYLVGNLARASIRLGLIHGDVPDDERRELRHRFSLDKADPQALDVLLSSEVGCEGLDFQFCDGLVNYDLPWNPMRVEQRIGRIDRYGQKSETAAIYNFITPGTVDAEIYERCLVRIGVFRQALGGSEEILGKLTREIHAIAENLELTDEERSARLQQLSDNEIRLVQEQNTLEEEQSKLFGLTLPKQDEDMVKQASSFWLAPAMLANLVARYLEALEVTSLPASLGRKSVVTLQLGQETRGKLLTDFQTLNMTGVAAQTWTRWLKGNDPYLALTFDPTTAADRRDLAFITPTHPLARQAAQAVEPTTPLICNLSAKADGLPPGRHPYAIYRWRKIGLKEDFTFQPVCADPAIAARMLELLETATTVDSPAQDITVDEERALETHHYRLWLDLRAAHIEQVTQTTQARLASLDTTHAARLALLEEQRDDASDARIRRMKESQIESARRDYERRADELRMAPGQADVIAEAVAFGVLMVEREMPDRMKELEKMRREWVEVTRKNGFREGITDLLAHQYSKKTHFIFELLQNAEDAGASKVEFSIENEQLVFSHNGDCLFADKDVESITSIGRSTKQTDYTQIGKHGIGFKAVFAYTHAPRIHSGDKHFVVEDVVVPRFLRSEEVPDDIKPGETRIILPFDSDAIPEDRRFRDLVPAALALQDITIALTQLSARTLLFLCHIEKLCWALPDGTRGAYLRETRLVPGRPTLRYVDITDGNSTETWIVFQRVRVVTDDGQNHQCAVEVAFLIQDGHVIPTQNTELVVYFPTEKKTELGFLIQGPFKTTKARDNIALDSKANEQLIETAAHLAADSLKELRDLALLHVESFKALPLKTSVFQDDSTRFFMPVYQAIREALKSKCLLPQYRGGSVAANEARLARGAQLAEVFSSEQLSALFGVEKCFWLDTAITADRMPEFRDYLVGKRKQGSRNEWEQEPLVEGIEIDAKDIAANLTAGFLQVQEESWLVDFYMYLDKNFEPYRDTPFGRLENGTHISTNQTFLPPRDPSGIDMAVFPLVKQSLVEKQDVLKFLRDKAKLREPDAVDVVIKCLLPKYKSGGLCFDPSEYQHDLKRIIVVCDGEGRNRMVPVLQGAKFIACTPARSAKSDEVTWRAPSDHAVFIRTPEMEAWFSDNDQDEAWFIHSVSKQIPNNRICGLEVAQPVPLLGCDPTSRVKIRLQSDWGSHRQGLDGFNPDAQILGLDFALQHWNQDRAMYLWSVLLVIPHLIKGDIQEESNANRLDAAQRIPTYSMLGKSCVHSAWLPDKQGVPRKPKELLLSDLHDGFEATTIRAKEVAERLGMKQPEQEQALAKLGQGDPRRMKLLEKIASATDDELGAFEKLVPKEIEPQPAPPFKDGLKGLSRAQRGETSQGSTNLPHVSNPGRYQKKLDEGVEDAVKSHLATPHTVTFSPVRVQPSNLDARNFLYSEYQGRCQVTGDTFPKASANAEGESENYFEACALLPYANTDYLNDAGNMLCVSADTMAKFKHASVEWLDDIEDVIERFNNRVQGNTATARILLAGEEALITWSERHFMRLIALWNKA